MFGLFSLHVQLQRKNIQDEFDYLEGDGSTWLTLSWLKPAKQTNCLERFPDVEMQIE